MDINSIWEQVSKLLEPHYLNILVAFFITQRVKEVITDRFKPLAAVLVGFVVATGAAVISGDYGSLMSNGLIYGAGSIALFMLGFGDLIKKWVPGGKKIMGGGSAKPSS